MPQGAPSRATSNHPVLVAGSGSWGTALAIHLSRCGHPVLLWGRDPQRIRRMRKQRRNERYLPQAEFPDALALTEVLSEGLQRVKDVVLAVPCNATRALLDEVRAAGVAGLRFIAAAKGFEADTHRLVADVVTDVMGPTPVAVLTGPSFAAEVARGAPTAVTIASKDAAFAQHLVTLFHSPSFRAYTIDDVIGAAVGGASKNVLAIAAGVSDGLRFGANARAALITRGLAEMTRVGVALGGRAATFMGLAGLGDLVLTCTDDQSRNRRLGLALAEGLTLEDAQRRIAQVAEGARTAYEVVSEAQRLGIEVPISDQVVRLLRGECTAREAVQALMQRDPKQEGG